MNDVVRGKLSKLETGAQETRKTLQELSSCVDKARKGVETSSVKELNHDLEVLLKKSSAQMNGVFRDLVDVLIDASSDQTVTSHQIGTLTYFMDAMNHAVMSFEMAYASIIEGRVFDVHDDSVSRIAVMSFAMQRLENFLNEELNGPLHKKGSDL